MVRKGTKIRSIGLWVYGSIKLVIYRLIDLLTHKPIDLSRVFLSLFILQIGINTLAHADLLPRAVLLPSASVAVSDDAMAVAFNPAGLGVRRGTNGYYLHTFLGSPKAAATSARKGDNALFISLSGFGFGAEFADHSSRFTKYTLSDGIGLSDSLYLGSSYAWFNSKDDAYDELSSWDVGLLYRTSRLFSIGLVARNLNRPMFNGAYTDRTYDLSLAFRPYTNRVTFSVDTELQEGQKVKDTYKVAYAMECELTDGVTLRGSYNNDGDFDVRVGIGFTQFEVGAYSRFDRTDGDGGQSLQRGGGVAYARLSNERYRTKFQTGKYFLEVEAKEFAREWISGSPSAKMGDHGESLLRCAREDETVDGIILKLGMDGYSMARVQEMRDAILDFRSSGKKTICYMELAGNKGYYLASVCDKIMLNPAGYLSLNGLRSEITFYKGVLDKLGIEADLYHIGKYKSASEMFTRESMSDAHRESLGSLLDDLHDQMVSGIAEGRGVSRAEVVEAIDQGPYTAREAMDVGIVDGLVYADQLEEIAKQEFGKKVGKLPGKQYASRKHHEYDWGAEPKLAVIYAAGTIAPGRSWDWGIGGGEKRDFPSLFSLLSLPRIMGSETITSAIKKAREDSSIKAIVLRVDSGGGSAFASDLIWREVMLTKDKKPVIVSMGGMAASGGYYIACPADVIVAEPGTVTGSIGVIAGKFSLRGLYDKLGINKEVLKRGENSDIYTTYSGFTDEQREIINRQIRELYDDFVHKAARGRNTTKEIIEPIAQGRIWTGRQARDNGLVDELGSLQLAISIAKAKADLEPDESVDIVAFPARIPIWRRFLLEKMPLYGRGMPRPYEILDSTFPMDLVKSAEGFFNERMFFLMPYTVDCE